MVQGREETLRELSEVVNQMIDAIAERESIEPDFAIVRELAEQLGEEIESLQG